jgi:predicted nucleic acid-binding protein
LTTFVDTSVWYAGTNIRDGDNARAKRILADLETPIMTDHVLAETWRLVRNRIHRQAAERFWDGVRRGAAMVENVTTADMEAAWAIGEAFPDQDFSLVDRTSFAVIERLGITRVASFDSHFAVYRYGRSRERAFDVLR